MRSRRRCFFWALMRAALQDLKLASLTVVHAGKESFPLAKNIYALACTDLVERLQPLK